ncbi:cytochrome c-type biogenesis protein CcmH [Pseudonocardia sp. KRD-184]|uniref:Cytochrome c-type biogenesis protein n=1 Tax=Pseudonocardia oceani TaxID=2792013 RepID=A0ABS6U2N2_9PSEU|nr:cytochrome c-type biogenesis protein [Pseudonocardia oceani]MBW0092469.1 cytochrome c-type biogenesis protein CcmH [Pseudonocardia oceani]MBW0097101.1 cytochrome c-type biogenesis protein CcmH [Pseudonocardia oceani]MBW0121942.1 cytochrome c-type biogenesis protein CcmH [Pseudonocardia oceani]MBW0126504.1 cytochrome c-type biogenesis protein CcmH [Pseudonocardia oceani]
MSDKRRSLAVAVLTLALFTVTVVALLTSARPAPDRAQDLAEALRCPVCQSVSIADSPSEQAVAMRQVVAEQVAQGRSDSEIVAFFQARYGDWVLLDPPTRGVTLALWLVPPVVAALGAVLIAARVRARPRAGAGPELDESDRARVDAAVTRARTATTGREDQP